MEKCTAATSTSSSLVVSKLYWRPFVRWWRSRRSLTKYAYLLILILYLTYFHIVLLPLQSPLTCSFNIPPPSLILMLQCDCAVDRLKVKCVDLMAFFVSHQIVQLLYRAIPLSTTYKVYGTWYETADICINASVWLLSYYGQGLASSTSPIIVFAGPFRFSQPATLDWIWITSWRRICTICTHANDARNVTGSCFYQLCSAIADVILVAASLTLK